jgi:hypothetical protein
MCTHTDLSGSQTWFGTSAVLLVGTIDFDPGMDVPFAAFPFGGASYETEPANFSSELPLGGSASMASSTSGVFSVLLLLVWAPSYSEGLDALISGTLQIPSFILWLSFQAHFVCACGTGGIRFFPSSGSSSFYQRRSLTSSVLFSCSFVY